MQTSVDAFHELSYYTLAHPNEDFIHQHVVDAFAAQSASADDKPIKVAFALIGLCLHLERGLNGRQVQLAHMQLAHRRKGWPSFPVPSEEGALTVHYVLRRSAGPERDAAIHDWCATVWRTWQHVHAQVRALADVTAGP
jgi:hypothetical protein